MKLGQIAFAILLVSISPSVAAPASIDLARRYVAANGGMTLGILSMHIGILDSKKCKQNSTCAATNTGRFKAIQQAMDKDRAALASADEDFAVLASQTFDENELEAYLSFWESPNGRSIQHHRSIEGIPYYLQTAIPHGLTKTEQDALRAYLGTPAAREIEVRGPQIRERLMHIYTQLQMQITQDAGAIYCQHTEYCKPWVHSTN